MTVESNLNKLIYEGNGIATSFPFTPISVVDDNELKIFLTAPGGAPYQIFTDFYVDMLAGTVLYPGYEDGTAPPVGQQPPKLGDGWKITILRELDITQDSDLINSGGFSSSVTEKTYDKFIKIMQQLDEKIRRAIQLPVDTLTSVGQDIVSQVVAAVNSTSQNATTASNAAAAATDAANTATSLAGQMGTAISQAAAALPKGGGSMTGTINEAKGADIASVTTTDIGAATGNYVNVTGVTSITALGTAPAGARRIVTFTGSLTLTHNATSLILPGTANIVTAVGDSAEFVSLGAGNWKCTRYTKADGTSVVSSGGGAQGSFKNLKILTAGGNPPAITADQVTVMNSVGQTVLAQNINVTLVGSVGAGGIDAGGFSANIWYSIWVIYNPTTKTASCIASLSATTPTMPSGYTFKARVGWVKVGSDGNWMQTIQYGRKAQYVLTPSTNTANWPVIVSGAVGSVTSPSYNNYTVSGVTVPTTACYIDLLITAGSGTNTVLVHSNYYAAAYTTYPNAPLLNNNVNGTAVGLVLKGGFVLESAYIYYASNGAATLNCTGWEDNI